MRRLILIVALTLLAAACTGQHGDAADIPELPSVTAAELQQMLTASSQPVVVNVWASWCIPCRSEAPLLDKAARTATDIRFIGLNVQDDQDGARGFIAQFFGDTPIDYFFDPGGDVPVTLGGTRGVPMTFFYAPGGALVNLHAGVIDERTLALEIDEIRAR
jgi:thiol-disulfide isomerase/thioredoxin